MKSQLFLFTALGLLCTGAAWSQSAALEHQNVPIYRVTVVERTVKAVDYQYRRGPTSVDFRGTVLLPKAKGSAVVESKAGRTEIEARFEHVEPPTRYGAEYLTYVLWAITPEGHPKNLGEVLVDASDHAKLRVTTDLQAFGMIVTAEPYSAVRLPSDVVVMENEVRPDTIGHIEQVSAKYDLMPRGHYTYEISSHSHMPERGEGVSMDRYEEILEVYQAQNAVQIARAAGADRYAGDTLGKAEQLLRNAQEFQARRTDKSTIITAARQAAQTAEDARAITEKRKRDEEFAQAQEQAVREQKLRVQAEADAQRARAEASADRMQFQEARTAREEAERRAAAASAAPPAPPQPETVTIDTSKKEVRRAVLGDLNATLETRDTPRGLAITLVDGYFRGAELSPLVYPNLQHVASIVAAHPGLYIEVDGHTDSSGSAAREEQVSYERAAAVRDLLVRSGVPANCITVKGFGSSRPLVSNGSASGRAQNRRVEIVVYGDPIGTVPNWDRTYSVVPRR